ncbi:MAG: hypothetical protein V3V08_11290, partial [Nannocystaceae bacterium]
MLRRPDCYESSVTNLSTKLGEAHSGSNPPWVAEVISLCGAEVRATSVEIVARGDEAAVTATVEAGHSEQLVKVI